MSALATGLGRTICLTALFLMASTVMVLGSWHFGWLRHGLAVTWTFNPSNAAATRPGGRGWRRQ